MQLIQYTLLVAMVFMAGCTTNQLHLASYSTEQELSEIRKTPTDVEVIEVSGIERCSNCTERSKVVWHAANYSGFLYEGYSMIPVQDWDALMKSALGSRSGGKNKAKIEIKQIFLKTWNSPEYTACQVEISVDVNGVLSVGTSRIKVDRPGQSLPAKDIALLDPESLQTIRIALKSAYLNSLKK
ncbi:hypothetical protein [Pseudomonas chlororaphis]|uniref:hypothetical protein n=1 Tax=Pseudomonas chlororaphis TaxID=587753 RepID=UPI0003D340AB|nr:hypothetical protein [Pseudomonas chlororaphis]AZD29017.1 hypothetical protein C4K23_2268 [Pseudomonas chlororaphis]ETD37985.1 hypothetical protein U724_19325 [Pseudomonas chlororaphis subsp. aurantiaca PB-St2]QFS54542.1 hypothetical protein FD951_08245 [Pseudomonas chlororaphis subsp. aurantiaca]